jgi:ubiquinone/menaquinone biosynthesis C-methylase UbiE
MNLENRKAESERIRTEYKRRDAGAWLAEIYSYNNPAFQFHMQEREWHLLQALRKHCFPLDGAAILEVGCGQGHILERFREFGAKRAFGIDLMENRIIEGKQRYPGLCLAVGDASTLPYADNQFDLVMQFMCLSSILDKEFRTTVASEMWRVLRPGGLLLSYDLSPPTFLRRLAAKMRNLRPSTPPPINAQGTSPADEYRAYREHPTPVTPVTMQEMAEWFKAGQFEVRSLSLDFEMANVARQSRLIAELLGRLPGCHSHFLALATKPFATFSASTLDANPPIMSLI